ncbi:hypothetical protein E2562_018752 [Oryza meyeriana var. granulata]|uniref:Uncharacterized protein n=1 Tax=Oryza meyeriana var. granulata TaxID=110450 RepID=A0A6G1EMV0_9ORYZ|nr:hypothetical protein E2562_018752 [Oryza meyeriana var. granulata]
MEALEKMPVSLEKSQAEAWFAAATMADYIFACFVNHDPNFCLELVEEGFQAASEEATNVI